MLRVTAAARRWPGSSSRTSRSEKCEATESDQAGGARAGRPSRAGGTAGVGDVGGDRILGRQRDGRGAEIGRAPCGYERAEWQMTQWCAWPASSTVGLSEACIAGAGARTASRLRPACGATSGASHASTSSVASQPELRPRRRYRTPYRSVTGNGTQGEPARRRMFRAAPITVDRHPFWDTVSPP